MPVRCRSWTAASPTIHSWSIGSSLRSTIVTGDAGRDGDPRRLEVRVADPDRRRSTGPRPGAAPRPRRSRPARATRAMPPTRARRPGRRCASHRASATRQAIDSGGRRRISSRIPPMPADGERQPDDDPDDVASCGRRRAVAPGRSSPAMTRDGAPAPRGVDREVEGELRRRGVDADLGQPADVGTQPMPLSERRSSSSDVGRRGAVAEAQAVVAGRGGEQRRACGRSAGRRRPRPAPRRSCRGPGCAAGPTGCRSGS